MAMVINSVCIVSEFLFMLFVCSLASAEKVEDQCEFPGCTKPKRKEGTRVHEYCCRDHADRDAPNRDG